MEHVVFYQSTQGTPAFRRLASIEDAVSFAEHLRNVEGVTDFSVYSLSPVSLKLRAYYHVEISDAERASQAGQPDPAPAEGGQAPSLLDAIPAPVAAPADDAPAPAEEPLPAFEAAAPAAEPEPPAFDRYAIPEPAAPAEEPAPPPVPAQPFSAEPLPAAASNPAMPFVAGPTASPLMPPEAFVKDGPLNLATTAEPEATGPADPAVVDPTVEEVVPEAPSGRRSMGFFARS